MLQLTFERIIVGPLLNFPWLHVCIARGKRVGISSNESTSLLEKVASQLQKVRLKPDCALVHRVGEYAFPVVFCESDLNKARHLSFLSLKALRIVVAERSRDDVVVPFVVFSGLHAELHAVACSGQEYFCCEVGSWELGDSGKRLEFASFMYRVAIWGLQPEVLNVEQWDSCWNTLESGSTSGKGTGKSEGESDGSTVTTVNSRTSQSNTKNPAGGRGSSGRGGRRRQGDGLGHDVECEVMDLFDAEMMGGAREPWIFRVHGGKLLKVVSSRRKRAAREARILRREELSQLVPQLFEVESLLEGRALGLLMEDCGAPLADEDQDAAFECVVQAARALQQLHGLGWTHGDVKPSNLCWNRTAGRARFIDWEFAQQGPARARGHTRKYASPEARDKSALYTSSSDMYSFGRLVRAFLERGLLRQWEHFDWNSWINALTAPNPAERWTAAALVGVLERSRDAAASSESPARLPHATSASESPTTTSGGSPVGQG
jgi:serine/threonine protein kinase